MPTFLLSWNPNNWRWPTLAETAARIAAGERVTEQWSCGNTKVIQAGDRIFLIRLGKAPRGIFGAGQAESPPFYAPHWNEARRARGEVTLFVMVAFDWLIDPESEPEAMLAFHYLEGDPRFSAMKWRLQKSGARIPDAVSSALEVEVRQMARGRYLLPTEVVDGGLLTEGAKASILVDIRERNVQARRQAIALHGVSCSVCGFTFGDYYGEIGEGYTEVHHLRQLAGTDGERTVDPAADLRPVCPNCHAMLHWRTHTPRKIEDVQEYIEGQVATGQVAFSWHRGR